MIYKVYELIKPEILSKTEPDGYDLKTTKLIALKEVDGWNSPLNYMYDSEAQATSDIIDNKLDLRYKQLVVLPVFDINGEGEIN